MTTLEKIRDEIEKIAPLDYPCDKRTPEHIRDMALEIVEKYAEQETDIEYIGEFCHKHGLVLMSKEMANKYAEQEQTGHWINKEFRKEEYVLMGKCSVCGRVRVIDEFCPNCGARMVEPQESEVNNG